MGFSNMTAKEILEKADELQCLVELLRAEAARKQARVWITPKGSIYHNDPERSEKGSLGALVPVDRQLAEDLWRRPHKLCCEH